jgi:hypothetical protein
LPNYFPADLIRQGTFMPNELFAPAISAGAILIVAIISGLASYLVGRGMKDLEWRLGMQREKIEKRVQLYSAFLAEADRLMLLSINKEFQGAMGFEALTSRYASIELLAAAPVVDAARDVLDVALDSHSSGFNRQEDRYALKRKFVDAARAELADLETRKS